MTTRSLAVLIFGLVLAVATLVPAFVDRDSFPFSNFPMFSQDHSSREALVLQILAVGADGERRPLAPGIATGNEAGLQAEAVIRDAVGRGERAVAELCRAAARRARRAKERFVSLEVASSTFDAVAFFSGKVAPLKREVHGRCWSGAGS